MGVEQLEIVRGAAVLGAILFALLLQRLAPHARLRGSWFVNVGLWLVNATVIGAVCGACAFATARWAAHEGIGALNWTELDPRAAAVASMLALDLVSYGWHRANHRVSLFWRFHQVHHSDQAFTVSTGIRFHPGELLLSLPVRLIAIIVLGASAEAVLAFEIVFTLANLVEHGDIDLPHGIEKVLQRVVVTPALHRQHHVCGPERDSNYGTIFSVWDRTLGTYTHNDSTTRVQTGLPGLDGVTLSRALTLPLQGLGGRTC